MSFVCPDCRTPGALEIALSIEMLPDARSDEISVQTVECKRCGFRAAAVYEESRRGAIDSEAWNHTGYRLLPKALGRLVALVKACPRPHNGHCDCESHRALNRVNACGAWAGLELFESDGAFPMHLVPAAGDLARNGDEPTANERD